MDGVSFEITRVEIFGFLSPNGAGKSTTARMLTGVIVASSGRSLILGMDIARRASDIRRHLGIVPEEANVYADLTVLQNVLFMAELHGIGSRERSRRAAALQQRFDLAGRAAQKGRELSKGLRQRLMLCMALICEPEILFLEEPTSGLDVASAHLIREMVTELNRERGMTVFLTTHNMLEAEQLCHRVAIIHRGRLAVVDTPSVLRARVESRRSVVVRLRDGSAAGSLAATLMDLDVTLIAGGFRVFTVDPGPLAQRIAVVATERSLVLDFIATVEPSLEEDFLSLTQPGKTGPVAPLI